MVKFGDYIYTGPRVGPQRPPEYPYIMVNATRGCPIGCSFCQVENISGKKVRSRDPEDFVNEIVYLKNKYGIKSIIFNDDDILMAKDFFVKMLQLFIEKQLDIKFIFGAFAIFLLNDEILDLMVEAGCIGVNVAIESGTERILKEVINKPVKLNEVASMINKIKEKGLFCLANFIIGFPGEKWEEIRETIKFAENCGADYVKFFVAVPLKGTKLWDLAMSSGSIKDDFKLDWRYSQISSDEWTQKDISILRAYEWDRVNFSSAEKRKRVAEIWGVSEKELDEIRKNTRDALIINNG